MKRHALALVCCTLWGCSSAIAPPRESVEVSLPSAVASASPTADSSHSARAAAVDACVAAIESSLPFDRAPGDSFKRVARACQSLYSEPGCSQAWALAAADETGPADRLDILTDGCRAAYCPSLGAGLDACAESWWSVDEFEARSRAWFELNEVIRRKELSPEQLQRLKSAEAKARQRRVEAVDIELPPPPTSQPISVELDSAGMVTAEGKKLPLAELSKLLGPARNGELVVVVEKATPMPIVMQFMDAAKAAGFVNVSMTVR